MLRLHLTKSPPSNPWLFSQFIILINKNIENLKGINTSEDIDGGQTFSKCKPRWTILSISLHIYKIIELQIKNVSAPDLASYILGDVSKLAIPINQSRISRQRKVPEMMA